jgi:hypothetical protein
MTAILILLLATLTVQVDPGVNGLVLVVVDASGNQVREMPASSAGNYVFDDLVDGTYTIRAVVGGTTAVSIPDVEVPQTAPVQVRVPPEAVAGTVANGPDGGAERNPNIQVNQIDNEARNEALERQGAEVSPVDDFSAVRDNYAAELGGVGASPRIAIGTLERVYRGEIFYSLQNSVLNARTFFQVGSVEPSRRNQYGFRFGGPLVSDKLWFTLTAEETRESGAVNGNVLVPLLSERTPTAEDPDVRALISRWLAAYPSESPNRPRIDPRLLNTNAVQKIRASGGAFRLDWAPTQGGRLSANYSLNDNFIDSFEFVGGQNPDQRLRPQNLNLAWQQILSERSTLRLGANYLRRKVHVFPSPGSVGTQVNFGNEIQGLGPNFTFPIRRVGNDFQYLVEGSLDAGSHQFDWGFQAVRSQLNEFQSDGARGTVQFRNNFGRSAIENFLAGAPTTFQATVGELYRRFRRTNMNLFVNDRIRLRPNLSLTLGLRYEFAGAPNETRDLTVFPFTSDANNFAPRIGLAYSGRRFVVRAGYGISFGEIFPATFRQGRLNPPEIIRVSTKRDIDLLDPLGSIAGLGDGSARSGLNLLDPELVAPYSHQYSLTLESELGAGWSVRTSYFGSRTWKLFRTVRENRAVPVDGIPLTTATINDRRPDQDFFSIGRTTNQARAYFDAAELLIEGRVGSRSAVRAIYTFSKALDTGSDFSNTGTGREEVRAQVESAAVEDLKAFSRFDAPHTFVLNYSVEGPSWLGGWVLSGTTILRSGTPFTVQAGTDAPPFGNGDGEGRDRPSLLDATLLGRSIDDPDTSESILRRDAFDAEAPSREGRGNVARNAFRKDGTVNFNLALGRTFMISSDRTRSLLVRAEMTNGFNHPQFSSPNTNLTTPAFGQITDTENAGRIVQIHLRLNF